MTPVKSFMTVNLGEGARVQFPQAVLNTGYAGATIQFGTISEVMQFQQFVPENTVNVPTIKGVAKKPTTEAVNEEVPKRASVFSRLSVAPTAAPIMKTPDPKLQSIGVNTTSQNMIQDEVPERYNAEIPDASAKLSRKARRKANARLRANGWMPNTPQESSPQLEANIPTNNGFESLKWVKRNDDKGQLKKSFWETSHRQPQPPKKEESASSKIYKILKAVKDRNLQRRLRKSVTEVISSNVVRSQNNKSLTKPYREEYKRPPYYREPREFCPNMGRYPYYGRKQLGEPSDSLHARGYNRRYDKRRPQQWYHESGHSKVHSDMGDRQYVTTRRQQMWVPKRPKYHGAQKDDHDKEIYKGRLKSLVQKLSPNKETFVDMTMPKKEENHVYTEFPDSPIIHWKRRSQLGDDHKLDANDDYYDDDDEVEGCISPMDIEVVRMVDHIPDRFNQRYTRRNAAVNIQNEEPLRDDQEQAVAMNGTPQLEEVEEEETEEVVKKLQLEIQSMQQKKDQEIHHLNARLDEMSNMMKQLFGQLGMMATTSQSPIANYQGNVQTTPDVLVTPDRGLEELQEPTLITPKEGELISKSQIENLISQKVKAAIASEAAEALVGKGRPYPVEYDQEKYPKGYVVPKFNLFDGTANPRQHLAQFKATCGNTGGNDALLLRQFVSSLTGTAFEWYAELTNDSVRTFAELETIFIKRFASATKKVTIADLALEKRKREESVTKYITRWRNLSMKCEQQLTEKHAVELLMGNIDDHMAPYLAMATINTFQELLDRVAKFERLPRPRSVGFNYNNNPLGKGKQGKTFDPKRSEVNTTFPSSLDTKEKENSMNPPNMLKQTRERQRPPTLQEKINKPYSFKKECTGKIFKQALKIGLQLPESRRPEQASMTDDPNYCPYHRIISHPIEDCFIFKDWVEKNYQNGELTLSNSVLVNPKREKTNVISSVHCQSTEFEKGKEPQEDEGGWETFISKKTKQMMNVLLAIEGIRHKSALELEVDPRLLSLKNPASVSRPKDGLDGDKLQASEKSQKSRAILARAGANGVVHDQALGARPVSDSDRPVSAGSSSGSGTSWGISSIFGVSENRAPAKEISSNKSLTVPSHNVEHSLSMIQLREPPVILKPSENQSEQEALEISITKLLLKSYYDIVRKNIEDTVPKAIMHFLVNHTKRELHNVFIRKLYRENLFDDMLREPDDIAAKRKRVRETLRVLQQAYKTLDELPVEADNVEKGYSLDSDSTGLPKVQGIPSSFYSASNDYSSPYTASPKNQRSRRSTHSGEQLSSLYPSSDANGLGSYPSVEA